MQDRIERLQELSRLLDEGKISRDEYDKLKAEMFAAIDDPDQKPQTPPTDEEEPPNEPVEHVMTRAELAEKQPAKPTKGTGCLITIGVIFALAILGSVCGDSGGSSGSDSYGAVSVCKEFVVGRLASPSSADFGGTSSSVVVTNRYRVTGWVDSQNAFGAQVRSDFVCVVTYQPARESWRLDSLSIG